MRIFKTKRFAIDAITEGLSDDALIGAVAEVRKNLIDARLGGNLVKKRVAISGKGKRGGLRTILVYKGPYDVIFCVYVFAKKDSENISSKQLEELKLLAKTLLGLDKDQIKAALKLGALKEVIEIEKNDDKTGS